MPREGRENGRLQPLEAGGNELGEDPLPPPAWDLGIQNVAHHPRGCVCVWTTDEGGHCEMVEESLKLQLGLLSLKKRGKASD